MTEQNLNDQMDWHDDPALDLDIRTEVFFSRKDHPEGKMVPVLVDGKEEFILIPLDIEDGATIKFSGRGKYHSRSGRTGDLYVLVHIEEKKNSWKKILIAALILAVIAIIFFITKKPEQTSQSAETLSSGKATEQSTVVTESGEETLEQIDWSDWVDELPAYVSADNYQIEEKTLYSSRTLETTSSTERNTLDGWELSDTVEAGSGFGAWSDWSQISVTASDMREVETQNRYHYRDKETTVSSSPTKSGWTLYDTTYSWGDYGVWSDWSESAVPASDSRKVETKIQYCYRDKWTTQENTSWSGWSDWTFDRQGTSDLVQEESRTVYAYCYFLCPYCGAHMHGWGQCWTWAGGCGAATSDGYWHEVWSTISWDQADLRDWHGTGKYYTYINGELVFKWPEGGTRTQYRYSTRSTQNVTNYGNWSNWGDTAYSDSSSREVKTRTVYRYCDRSQVAAYHFYRWGSWSDWTTNMVSSSNDRQVESTTYYRYRDQVKAKTYCFQRWTDWTDFSDIVVEPSEMIEVQTKTQYRYKVKSE